MKLSANSLFFSIALVAFLLGCSNPKEKMPDIPDNVLKEEEFVKLLTDYALAESASNMNIKNVAFQKTDTIYAFDPLKENGIRKSQYDSTVAFYSQHTVLYKKIYETVLQNLTEYQTKKNDSLAKVSK